MKNMRTAINAVTLKLYRTFAVVTLYAVLLAVLGYAGIMGFYVLDADWTIPVIISASDEKGLEMVEKITTSNQTLEALRLDKIKTLALMSAAGTFEKSLYTIRRQLDPAVQREQLSNNLNAVQLAQLATAKTSDNATTVQVMTKMESVAAQIKQDLASGLITKSDAALLEGQINQMHIATTDSKIAEVVAKDLSVQKRSDGTTFLEILSKKATLEDQVRQLQIVQSTGHVEVKSDDTAIALLEQAIVFAKDNPYYQAVERRRPSTLIFVPYDNRAGVVQGAPVYTCYMQVVGCHQVGVVETLYTEEEHALNPIFHTDVRGFLVQLKLSEKESAKSTVLFVGRKPLFF